jgi:predicted acyl esterase
MLGIPRGRNQSCWGKCSPKNRRQTGRRNGLAGTCARWRPPDADLEIAGSGKLTLYASSTRNDLDFIVKVQEQFTQTEDHRAQGLQPRYVIAYRSRKGNRIRLEIANGDSPVTDGLFFHFYRPDKIGVATIYHDAEHPSDLVLLALHVE